MFSGWSGQALRKASPFLALALVPLLLLAANRSWLWDSTYYHDSNVYIGFFRHYLEFTPPFIANYKLSRLPFVLPGVLAYAALPAGLAHHLLHLVFLIGEAWLVFGLTRTRFGAHAAFAVAAALLVFTYSHTLPSYHNQAASTYFVGALALLEGPKRWPSWLRMLLTGGVFAFAVTTDSIVGTLLPVLLLRAVVSASPRTLGRLGSSAALGVLGAIVAFCLLGSVNALLGGRFLFFLEQVKYSVGMAEAHSMSQLSTLGMLERFGEFPQLTFPLVTVVLACGLALQRVIARRWDFALLEAASVLVATAIAAVEQNAGLKLIEEPCLFHPFFVPMFLALPALVSQGSEALPERVGPSFIALAVALVGMPLALGGQWFSRLVLELSRGWPSAAHGVPLALGLSLPAAVAVGLLRRAPAKMAVVAGSFGLMNALSTALTQPAYLYQAGASCAFRHEAFDAILHADGLFAAFDPKSEARWKSVGVVRDLPEFDGRGWCTLLPIETVARDALLPRYFYTTDELLHGPQLPPLKKIALVANTQAQMEALTRDVWTGVPASATTRLAFERELKYSTFSLVLRGYDITLGP